MTEKTNIHLDPTNRKEYLANLKHLNEQGLLPPFVDPDTGKFRQPTRASDNADWTIGPTTGIDAHEETSSLDGDAPDLFEKVASFALASLKHAKSGLKTRPPEEIDRIRRICELCDHVYYEGLAMRCGKCGCKMNIKITWATTQCPVGKW